MSAPLALGPFDLYEPVGRGGMAQVWSARHRGSGVPVAVKILDAALAHDGVFREAFAAEVRAVAGLDHPGVVHVFDHGVVSRATASASAGRIPTGSPFLVMEYASAGTLLTHPPRSGAELLAVLVGLLDALGHAHARGVIHRDLKGGNVLLCGAADLRPGWKLSDFGLAYVPQQGGLDEGDAFGGSRVGTPAYMAPEQVRGELRDFGPWTDLYALGCLAWKLATGRPPFGTGPADALASAHLESDPPDLRPLYDLPPGFEAWARRLLRKRPADRFPFAADAARALRALPFELLPEPSEALAVADADPESQLTVAAPAPRTTRLIDRARSGPSDGLPSLQRLIAADLAEAEPTRLPVDPAPGAPEGVPGSWRAPDRDAPSPQLQGAGVGLLPLRRVPMVGREGQRDRLWAELAGVFADGRARVALLHGERGQGKSRLAQWICERSSELGLARSLVVRYGPVPGGGDGLAAMLSRRLGLAGLDRSGRRARILDHLARQGVRDALEAESLLALASSGATAAEPGPGLRLGPTERRAVFRRFLAREGADRPVLVWFDDLERSPGAMGLCRSLLEDRRVEAERIFVVATVASGALRGRGPTAEALRGLLDLGAIDLPVQPLSEDSERRLVAELLDLEPALADAVRRRAEGNPLFAVQLLGDLAERGVLVPTERGFAVAPGADAALPRDIHALWDRRVQRALQPFDRSARHALELAAALGERVLDAEWTAAAAVAGLRPPEGLVEALLEGGLARPEDEGWSLTHGLLREALVADARAAGRWTGWNVACAAMLRAHPGPPGGPRLERTGRHLLEAERWAEALPTLFAAAEQLWKGDESEASLRVLTAAAPALDRLGAGPEDERRLHADAVRADALFGMGRVDEAVELAEGNLERARRLGLFALEARSLLVLGQQHLRGYRGQDARELLEPALARFRTLPDRSLLGRALRLTARALAHLRDFEGAERRAREARSLAEQAGNPSEVGEALQVLAAIARHRGDPAAAEALNREAAGAFERAGHRALLADCWVTIGEARREAGDLGEALRWFERATDEWRRVGSDHSQMGELCEAGVLLELERPAEALPILLRVRRVLVSKGQRPYLRAALTILMLAALTELGRWAEVPHVLDELEHLAALSALSNPEFVVVVDRARELAQAAGRTADSARLALLAARLR